MESCQKILISTPKGWETSLVAQTVKRLPTTWETWVRSLGREDPLEKEMATHSSTLAWKIPWMEEPGNLQSVGLQRVGHNWATSPHLWRWNLHKSTWSSHRYTYIPSLLNPSPTSHPILPSRFSQNTGLSSLLNRANSHLLSVLHTAMYTFPCSSHNSTHSLLTPLYPQGRHSPREEKSKSLVNMFCGETQLPYMTVVFLV